MGLSCSMCVFDVYVVTDLQTTYIMKTQRYFCLQTFTLVYYISEVTWQISHKMLDQSRYTKEEHTLQKWSYLGAPRLLCHPISLNLSSLFHCLRSQLSSGDFVHPLLLPPHWRLVKSKLLQRDFLLKGWSQHQWIFHMLAHAYFWEDFVVTEM